MTSPPLSPEWSALAGRVVAEYRAAIGDNLVAIALFGSVARLASRRGRRPVTNGERADRLVDEAREIAGEMKNLLGRVRTAL